MTARYMILLLLRNLMKKALTKYDFRVHEVLAFLKAKLNVHVVNKEQEIRIN